MTALLRDLLREAQAFSPLEVVAVVFAAAYLVLAIRQNIWCWFCALLSTGLYMFLFVDAKLYMEAVLNLFYLAMAVYGWHVWLNGGRDRPEMPVCTWPLRIHLRAIVLVFALAAATGLILERYSDAAFPYIDSLTTFGAIWTTFLVARKVLENWWYWLAIDSVSVVLYWMRDLPLTAMLFVVYLALIPIGLVQWTRSWREQAAS